MRINFLYYLIFTGICIVIPVIGWGFWLGTTVLIVAYNFLIMGSKSKRKKEELEDLQKKYTKELINKKKDNFWD
ncbi:hypothetical protein J5A73_10160 [Leptotrichia sp. oral taxon 218]|uniref:hypothetical protein n=1 Tax=Leptotrichia sp. oral taxon 218 TaxID=712361 RepID=UPI001B8CA9ED|nr:hypothetical protein [Leptotrichia sp. oral taxon 218]QUB95301.1 hypothetical protein J5A73_10160 [Leptotrichia sp. oral taxon 218]